MGPEESRLEAEERAGQKRFCSSPSANRHLLSCCLRATRILGPAVGEEAPVSLRQPRGGLVLGSALARGQGAGCGEAAGWRGLCWGKDKLWLPGALKIQGLG